MPALPAFTVPYKTVEAALIRMHNIPTADVAAFRSRLGALQRGGLLGTGNQPGKGQKLIYSIDQFRRLVLAIELIESGFAPSIVLRLVKEDWERLSGIISRAERANDNPGPNNANDVVLVLPVDLMFNETLAINHTTRNKLPQQIELVFSGEHFPARLLLINLSAQMRKFQEALSFFHLQADQHIEAALAPKA